MNSQVNQSITLDKSSYKNHISTSFIYDKHMITIESYIYSDTIMFYFFPNENQKIKNFYLFDYSSFILNEEIEIEIERLSLQENTNEYTENTYDLTNEDKSINEDDENKTEIVGESSIKLLLGRQNEKIGFIIKRIVSFIVYELKFFIKKVRINKIFLSFSIENEYDFISNDNEEYDMSKLKELIELINLNIKEKILSI